MRIKIRRVILGDKKGEKIVALSAKTAEEFKKLTLEAFRVSASTLAPNFIKATDQFVCDDEAVELENEKDFNLSESAPDSLDAAQNALTDAGVIIVWSKEHIEAERAPKNTELTLTVKRKPKATGDVDGDKTYKIMETEFNAMTLDKLRGILVGKRYILSDDQFFDQGLVIEKDEERNVNLRDICEGEDKEIDVRSKSETAAEIKKNLEIKRQEEWEQKAPKIDLTSYKPGLALPPLPGHTPATDHTGTAPKGFASTAVPDKGKVFSELDAKDVRAILTDSRLYPNPSETPACAALTVADEIDFARENIVHCERIRTVGTPYTREDTIDFTYSEEVMKWQRQMVSEASVGASIPLVLGFESKTKHTDARKTFRSGTKVCLTATIAIPKARVILDKVSVTAEFEAAVAEAIKSDSKGAGAKLMHTLAVHGHLIATDFLVGGKVMCSTTKTLNEDYSAQELGHEFSLATQGTLAVKGVPVSLGGGSGWSELTAQEKQKINQRYSLTVKTIGGFGETSGSTPEDLGKNWLDTVLKFPRTWRVIGIVGEIKPSLSYLPASLQKDAKTLLREYFDSKLTLQRTPAAGGTGGKVWVDNLTDVRRIAGVDVQQYRLIDGMQIHYGLADGGLRASPWHGESKHTRDGFRLEKGDEIVAVEVGSDVTVDHLIFWTKHGRRYPPTGQFGWTGAKKTALFDQPRIQGFHGKSGHFLDSLGVQYLDLTKPLDGISKSALLTLEKYIYET